MEIQRIDEIDSMKLFLKGEVLKRMWIVLGQKMITIIKSPIRVRRDYLHDKKLPKI